MAGLCSPPPCNSVLKSAAALRPVTKFWMLNPRKLSVNRSLSLQIVASSIKNKVFEDRSKGVICYEDDQGEIICEGYDDDEPRFHQKIENTPSYPRSDAEVKMDLLLQRPWLAAVKHKDLNDDAAAGRADHRVNGFTSYVSQSQLYIHILLIMAFVANRS